jgi:hypothetical protein
MGVDGGDGRRWVIRESAWLRSFSIGRGNAWTEITHAQDPRRAEAVRLRHIQTQDRRQPWLSATAAGDCIRRARRAGLGWPLPEGLTEEALAPDRGQGSAATAGRVGDHRELRRPEVTLQLLWEEHRAAHPDGYGYSRFCE